MILCIGYSRRNCIKIQLAEPQEDIQDTDKPVLPTLGGKTFGRVSQSSSPVIKYREQTVSRTESAVGNTCQNKLPTRAWQTEK